MSLLGGFGTACKLNARNAPDASMELHPDLDELLRELLGFAQQQLVRHAEFYPFAATKSRTGGIVPCGGYISEGNPPSQAVLDLLVDGIAADVRAGDMCAAGICLDVRTTPPGATKTTDAICVRLDHECGDRVDVYVPYRRGMLGTPKFGAAYVALGTLKVF